MAEDEQEREKKFCYHDREALYLAKGMSDRIMSRGGSDFRGCVLAKINGASLRRGSNYQGHC